MKRKIPAAGSILGALVLGVVVGFMIFISFPDKRTAASMAGYISILSDLFLRLIKMVIGPLVFAKWEGELLPAAEAEHNERLIESGAVVPA